MHLKKTALATALATSIGISVTASADILNMTFTGVFTLINATGAINANSDASSNIYGGLRTAASGIATFDTATGAGSAVINPFSFFGAGAATATSVLFQAIGNGGCTGNTGPTGPGCGPGTLVAGQMGFNWSGNFVIPVTAIFDAAGFFANIPAPGTTATIDASSTGNAISTTRELPAHFGTNRSVGAVPMAMTNFNTNGATLGSIYPLSVDSIAGSPMTTAPFPGQHVVLDFTSMVVTNCNLEECPDFPIPPSVILEIPGGSPQECTDVGSSSIPMNAQITIPDGDSLDTISWLLDGSPVANEESVNISVPLGTHIIEVTVTTILGRSTTRSQTILLRDTTRPVISAEFVDPKTGLAITTINSPHKADILYSVVDVCDPAPTVLSATVGIPAESGDRIKTSVKNSSVSVSIQGNTDTAELTVTVKDASGNMSSSKALLTIIP